MYKPFDFRFGCALVLGLAACSAQADVLMTGFEPPQFPAGSLPGGADTRVPGNANQWHVPDNAATFGEVRSGVGLNGSAGLVIGNRGNGNDGVIDNVKSGKLLDKAGEPTLGNANNAFESSFWFRTASSRAVSGYAFKSEAWGSDRDSYVGFFSDPTGNLTAGAYDIDANGDFSFHQIGGSMAWGAWYRVVTQMVFNDGANNDMVNQLIYNADGSLFGSVTGIGSWEEGARVNGYNGGMPISVDAIGFQARGSAPGDTAVVDDVRWRSFNTATGSFETAAAVPEPGSLVLIGAGIAGLVMRRRRQAPR